jgi:hypothetical protein
MKKLLLNSKRLCHLMKGKIGNPIGRLKGSVSTTTKLIREYISQAIDGNKNIGIEYHFKLHIFTEY